MVMRDKDQNILQQGWKDTFSCVQKDNMFVANCTSPANYFHLLRRQQKTNYRKPLIVFTPKSLLRHAQVISSKEELAEGSFQTVIDDAKSKVKDTKTLVFLFW